MRIASMTLVGNESEIIESFVRYNCGIVDKMLMIIESGCVDNTLQIILKLKEEGYPIIIKDESTLPYEQKYIDNKYLQQLADMDDVDLIIPLDCDEFITSKNGNPRDIIETLTLDRIYKIRWKSYIMTPEDDKKEKYIPKRIKYCKRQENPIIQKVMVPAQHVKSNHIVLETGKHFAHSDNLIIEELETIQLAHYPMISKEQYLSKLYCTNINFITWMSRGNGEGGHQNKQIAKYEQGEDVFSCAAGYGLSEYEPENIIEDPINLKFCKKENLEIKYSELGKVNLTKNIVSIGRVVGIRAYNWEIEKKFVKDKETILVYGAGKDANNMLSVFSKNVVNVRAYIDSNPEKNLTMFNGRLVITPNMIRYFKYDKIMISSKIFYDDMKKMLIDNRIEEAKICGPELLETYENM